MTAEPEKSRQPEGTSPNRGVHEPQHPSRRTIALGGLKPFSFETHGSADAYVSHSIDRYGMWEMATTGLLLELLKSDADLIDVGANIGWHSIVAGHRLGERGQVHCFEPEQQNIEKLRTNVALSGLKNMVVNEWALSDSTRFDLLNLSQDNLGDHRLGAPRAGRAAVQVEVRRLDDYAGIRQRPLVAKLDVQGSEWHVLRGAERLLGNHPHEIVLICELCPALLRECGVELDDLCELLAESGFAVARVDQGTGAIEPMAWGRLTQRITAMELVQPDSTEDIVAFRRPDGLMRSFFKR